MIRRPIDLIVIHCSATPNGKWITDEDINSWHAARGFRRTGPFAERFNPSLGSIGYHYVIGTNGAIWTGRHMQEVGAHAQSVNQRSVGICMVGTDKFSLDQWDALKRLFNALPYALFGEKAFGGNPEKTKAVFAARGVQVVGHRDVPGVRKTCPGFDAGAWFDRGCEPDLASIYTKEIA